MRYLRRQYNERVIMYFGGVPGYCFYDALQFIIRGWVSASLRENKVDGVKESGQRLGQVGCFIWLKRILQILLWTGKKPPSKQLLMGFTKCICKTSKCQHVSRQSIFWLKLLSLCVLWVHGVILNNTWRVCIKFHWPKSVNLIRGLPVEIITN